MTLHFAAARSPARSPLARALAHRVPGPGANDNGDADEALLTAALRYFAVHGLGAARSAAVEAERALVRGDRHGYDRWLGVCRTLDRRMASRLARRIAEARG